MGQTGELREYRRRLIRGLVGACLSQESGVLQPCMPSQISNRTADQHCGNHNQTWTFRPTAQSQDEPWLSPAILCPRYCDPGAFMCFWLLATSVTQCLGFLAHHLIAAADIAINALISSAVSPPPFVRCIMNTPTRSFSGSTHS